MAVLYLPLSRNVKDILDILKKAAVQIQIQCVPENEPIRLRILATNTIISGMSAVVDAITKYNKLQHDKGPLICSLGGPSYDTDYWVTINTISRKLSHGEYIHYYDGSYILTMPGGKVIEGRNEIMKFFQAYQS